MPIQTLQEYRTIVSAAPDGPIISESDSESFATFTLSNGLRVIFHEDHTTPMVVVNVIYHAGSKNEQRGRTGFAHLFEHLMFDGSRNVPRGGYDLYCTSVGGDNNAFTSSDITDYFIAVPSDQLALGLWLESDRMAEFAVQEISLDTQKSVVMEEKRQTIDNVPYGSMPELMRELAYDPTHPYSWEIIGSMDDIAGATMEDVRSFYERFYVPSNALLVVAGDFDPVEAMSFVQGYFDPIPSGTPASVPVPSDSLLRHGGLRKVRDGITPLNAIFLGYHAPTIYDRDLHALELLAAILSDGESSRLYQNLEYTLEIASETGCYIDEGELGSLIYIYAVAQNNKVSPKKLRNALDAEIARVVADGVREEELQKAKNRKITRIAHDLQSISDRAERLSYFTMLFDDPMRAFREADQYESITTEDIRRVAGTYLTGVEPNVVEYRA